MEKRFDSSSGCWVIRLDRGENVIESIHAIAKKENLFGAEFSAIGALEDPVLAYYNLPAKQYVDRHFPGIFETSMNGNISFKDGGPFLHTHPIISGPDLNAIVGHLRSARVGVTLECFVRPLRFFIPRTPCPLVGLEHWNLSFT